MTQFNDRFGRQIAERNAAFENDDLSWASRRLPDASSPAVVEIAFHKARYECRSVSDAKRLESQKWLVERGFSAAGMKPISIGDPLP